MPQLAPAWLVTIAGEGGAAAIMLAAQAAANVAIQVDVATAPEAQASEWGDKMAGYPELPALPPLRPKFWRERADASLLSLVNIPNEPGGTGPVLVFGDCLNPVGIVEGDLVWFHPKRPARDGDLVLVEWDQEQLEFVRQSEDGKRHRDRMGEMPTLAVKALFSCGAEYVLVTRVGVMDLGRARVWPIIRVEKPLDFVRRVMSVERNGEEVA